MSRNAPRPTATAYRVITSATHTFTVIVPSGPWYQLRRCSVRLGMLRSAGRIDRGRTCRQPLTMHVVDTRAGVRAAVVVVAAEHADRVGGRLGPPLHAQLGEQRRHVVLHRLLRQEHPPADLPVAQP